MDKSKQTVAGRVSVGMRACVAIAAYIASSFANAVVINDNITFTTENQSMWSQGGQAIFQAETFLGTQWGTYEGPGHAAETLSVNLITGDANTPVPGTGGTLPNPAYLAWNTAFAACNIALSEHQCKYGTAAVKVCAPSWLGGGCTTVIPATRGLGNPPPATIDNPIDALFVDTRTGVAAELASSGEAGIVPWVEAKGGGIDVTLPVGATITIPDAIASGAQFTLSTEYSVTGGSITANAPSFKAGVDGVINIENTFSGTACVILAGCATAPGTDIDILPGRFGIVSIDLSENNFLRVLGDDRGVGSFGVPGIAFDKEYAFYVPTPENPDGVDDETTPKKIPSPRLGDIEVGNLSDFSGGAFDGEQLAFTTNQQLLSLNMSVTGLSEFLMASPGILANKIGLLDIGPINLELKYALLDLAVGPRFGMEQNFGLTPELSVMLQFDQPVTTVADGVVHGDGIVQVALGDDLNLQFDGAVGQLVSRTFFMNNPVFTNSTLATIDPGLKIIAGCLELPAFNAGCLYDQDFRTTGLLGIPVYNNSWVLGGFGQYTFSGYGSTGPGAGIAVPEPDTLALLALGLMLIGAGSFRKLLPKRAAH